jgi:hypothetical protein
MKNKIIYYIETGLRGVKEFFQELLQLPYAKRYLILFPFTALLAVIILFPYELILFSVIQKECKGSCRAITAQGLASSYPGYIEGESLSIIISDKKSIVLEKLVIDHTINPLRLITRSNISLNGLSDSVKISTPEFSFNVAGEVIVKISDLSFKDKPTSGVLDVFINKSDISFPVSQSQENMMMEIISGKKLLFNNITFKAQVKNNQYEIKSFSFNGREIQGHLSGTISPNGVLNLTGGISKNSHLLHSFSSMLKLIKGNELQFHITGSTKKPIVSMDKGNLH